MERPPTTDRFVTRSPGSYPGAPSRAADARSDRSPDAHSCRSPGRQVLSRLCAVRIFVAGATGVIGIRLVPLLAARGHVVAGMTRSASNAGLLAGLGAQPVVCDVYDADALTPALVSFAPDVVFHQLTDLPDDIGDMAAVSSRNDRMRSEGTGNLLAAAAAAEAERVIAQSISWELPSAPPEPPRIHVDDAARQTLPALAVPAGVTIVADDRAQPGGS